MRQYLDILDNTLEYSKIAENFFKAFFSTSADVVMKASGLRLEAIRVIAREQGVEIEDTACRCIDESLLAALADAHVRKMRAYFNNARRHIAELSGDELAMFLDFCETFKNRQSIGSTAQAWSDIDTDAIREQFIQKVHELTPSIWSDSLVDRITFQENFSLSFEYVDTLDTFVYKQRCDVVEKILHSHLYYEKLSKTRQPSVDIRSVVWRFTLPARYHIFTSDDDNHQQNMINNPIIHHAPTMVA